MLRKVEMRVPILGNAKIHKYKGIYTKSKYTNTDHEEEIWGDQDGANNKSWEMFQELIPYRGRPLPHYFYILQCHCDTIYFHCIFSLYISTSSTNYN